MKIKMVNNTEVDTDLLDDRKAAAHEIMGTFYSTCEKYNIIGFSKIILNDKESLNMIHIPNGNEEIKADSYIRLVESLATWIQKTSNGRLKVVDTEGEGSEEEGNKYD